uniref:Coiled-coil domain-containing protein n=1 Tax=Macrostomum lignano TaxID=282301 RepID=A0A1I8FLL2_9PLAT
MKDRSRLRAFKEREEEELQSYLALLRRKQAVLSAKVQAYRKFETYMTSVVDILPPDLYTRCPRQRDRRLIMRYNTLEDTFNRLLRPDVLRAGADQETRDRESPLKADHARDVLSKNSQLAELHEATERQKGTQEQHEQQVSYRGLRHDPPGIDNVATRCLKRHDPHLQSLDWPEEMEKIRATLDGHGEEVVRAVQDQMARGVTPSATPGGRRRGSK